MATKYAAAGGEDAVVRPGGEGEARQEDLRAGRGAVGRPDAVGGGRVVGPEHGRKAPRAATPRGVGGARPGQHVGEQSRARRRAAGGAPVVTHNSRPASYVSAAKKTCPPDSANGRGRESLVFRLMSVSSAALGRGRPPAPRPPEWRAVGGSQAARRRVRGTRRRGDAVVGAARRGRVFSRSDIISPAGRPADAGRAGGNVHPTVDSARGRCAPADEWGGDDSNDLTADHADFRGRRGTWERNFAWLVSFCRARNSLEASGAFNAQLLQRLSLRRCRRAGIAGVGAALFADLDDHAVLGARELDGVHDWLRTVEELDDLAAAGTSSAARWFSWRGPRRSSASPAAGTTRRASRAWRRRGRSRRRSARGASRRGRRPRRDRR